MSWKFNKLTKVQAQQEKMRIWQMGITYVKVLSLCPLGKNEQNYENHNS
jgi:hypothetical protein